MGIDTFHPRDICAARRAASRSRAFSIFYIDIFTAAHLHRRQRLPDRQRRLPNI